MSRLQQLDSTIIERPLDLDRPSNQLLAAAQNAPELLHLRTLERWRRHEIGGNGCRVGRLTMSAADLVILATSRRVRQRAVGIELEAIGRHLALRER